MLTNWVFNFWESFHFVHKKFLITKTFLIQDSFFYERHAMTLLCSALLKSTCKRHATSKESSPKKHTKMEKQCFLSTPNFELPQIIWAKLMETSESVRHGTLVYRWGAHWENYQPSTDCNIFREMTNWVCSYKNLEYEERASYLVQDLHDVAHVLFAYAMSDY